jgi:hypothetical protein
VTAPTKPAAAPQPEAMLVRPLVLWRKRSWPLSPKFMGAFHNREAFVKWVGTQWHKPLEYVTVHDASTGAEAYRYYNVPDLMAAPVQYLQQPAETRPTWTTPANAKAS